MPMPRPASVRSRKAEYRSPGLDSDPRYSIPSRRGVLGEFACSKNGLSRGRQPEGWHTMGPSSSLACNLHLIEQQRETRFRAANRIAIKEWIEAAISASLLVVSDHGTHSGATKNNGSPDVFMGVAAAI